MYLEYSSAVFTYVCDLELSTQAVERENVHNAPSIKIHRGVPKICFLGSLQSTLVTMNADGFGGLANVVDVLGT